MTTQRAGQPLPQFDVVSLDEADENEVLVEIAQEFAKEIYEEIDDAYPNLIVSPAVLLPPRERLQRYLLDLIDGAQGDAQLASLNMEALLQPDFVDGVEEAILNGAMVPPISPLWDALLPLPKIMKRLQSDFRTCYRTWAQGLA